MTTKMPRIALSIVFAALVAAPSQAAEDPQVKAEKVRDEAISRTAAWRAKSAESILNKNLKFEATQPWLTAQAFLMATYGIGQDEEMVNKALAILDKQAKKNPQDPVAEFYRGEVLQWTGESDKAMKAWQHAKDRATALVSNDEKDARAQFYLGASLVYLKKPGDARKALKKAEKLGFDQPMINFQIGLTYLMEENWKAAVTSYDAVFDEDPRYAHLYFYRGLAWDKLGEKDRFINDLDQFVRLAPNSPQAKTARAILASVQ